MKFQKEKKGWAIACIAFIIIYLIGIVYSLIKYQTIQPYDIMIVFLLLTTLMNLREK